MRGSTLEMMRDHVRSIHRAIAGGDPPEPSPPGEPSGAATLTSEEVARRFAELEAIARSNPHIAERVPPFSFTPLLDVIGTEREIILELSVPGAQRGDVEVEPGEGHLIVSGARSTEQALDGRVYLHAELPRGPFRRVVELPEPTSGAPRVEVENGVVRIRLSKTSRSPMPRA